MGKCWIQRIRRWVHSMMGSFHSGVGVGVEWGFVWRGGHMRAGCQKLGQASTHGILVCHPQRSFRGERHPMFIILLCTANRKCHAQRSEENWRSRTVIVQFAGTIHTQLIVNGENLIINI